MVKITNKIQLKIALKSLRYKTNDIEGCSIVTRNGLVIESELLADVENKTFAALSADITKSGEIAASELKIGKLSQIIINTPKGSIITTNIGKKAILVCLVQKKANLGLVILHMTRTAERLSRLINWG